MPTYPNPIVVRPNPDLLDGDVPVRNRPVGELMVPRRRVEWLDAAAPVADTVARVAASRRSRFPLCDGALDRVVGVVEAKELLARAAAGDLTDVRALAHPAATVPPTIRCADAVAYLDRRGARLAVVVEPGGGVRGVVSAAALLREVAGQVFADTRPVQPRAHRRPDGSWLLDGALALADARALLAPERPYRGGCRTLGGFAAEQLGRVPIAGDRFVWAGWEVEVVDMDGRRVDKVLASPRAGPPADAAE